MEAHEPTATPPVMQDGVVRLAEGPFKGTPLPKSVSEKAVTIVYDVRTTCRYCSSGIPIHGPRQEVRCPSCGSVQQLDKAFWRLLLVSPHQDCEEAAEENGGYGEFASLNGSIFGDWHVCRPHCPRCLEKAPRKKIVKGEDRRWSCPGCDAALRTSPAPGWLQDACPGATRILTAEDPSLEGAAASQAARVDSGSTAALLSCPHCGGALSLKVTSPRIFPCPYCQERTYLTDSLWQSLHPAWRTGRWQAHIRGRPLETVRVEDEGDMIKAPTPTGVSESAICVQLEITTRCPHCSSRVPLNSPTREAVCPRCLAKLALDHRLWVQVFRTPVMYWEEHLSDYGSAGGGWSLLTGLLRGAWQVTDPACPGCGEAMAGKVPWSEPEGRRPCPECDAVLQWTTPPKWLSQAHPEVMQVICKSGPDPSGHDQDADTLGSAHMACPACGAPERITAASPRIVRCGHCSSDLYIPDPLWQTFHQVQGIERWYVVLSKQQPVSEAGEPSDREIQPHRILCMPDDQATARRTGWRAWLGAIFGG